jgi:hypothetical protein
MRTTDNVRDKDFGTGAGKLQPTVRLAGAGVKLGIGEGTRRGFLATLIAANFKVGQGFVQISHSVGGDLGFMDKDKVLQSFEIFELGQSRVGDASVF